MTSFLSTQPATTPEAWINKHYIEALKPISEISIPTAGHIVESGPPVFESIIKEVLFRACLRSFSPNRYYSFTGYNLDLAMPHLTVENGRNIKILGYDNSEQDIVRPSEVTVRDGYSMPVAQVSLPEGLLGEQELAVKLLNKKFPNPLEHLGQTWESYPGKKAVLFKHLAERSLDNMEAYPRLWKKHQPGMAFLKTFAVIPDFYEM